MDRNTEYDNTKEILEFHCPRYNELPHIPLYKDQVITFIEDALKVLNLDSQESLLTPTMVNNYVKQKVVSPPKNKRYNETHLAYLIVVCILKQVFSLTEICKLIRIQIETCPIEQAYDYFCAELEKAIVAVSTTRDFSETDTDIEMTFERELVKSAVGSFVHKIYIQKCIMD
ncbi:DUF1836 domain-containing protein [Clostridium paraputrificum]|uniref:DUF1836 domain-containing protein n=1 Tax=Clostridium TaxID=1485 RepID=UPI003D33AF3B